MDCERVAREEILDSYLVGRLSEEDREALEAHYFECARCFDDLTTLKAIQGELRRTARAFAAGRQQRFLRWAPAAGLAAVAVLAAGVMFSMRAPAPTALPESPPAQTPVQTQSPDRPLPRAADPADAPPPSLEQLARVEPPRYDPLRLRGAPDEATARFERGMERYRAADYQAAIGDLREAAELDPDATHIRFFLGISHLMSGQDNAAIQHLRATIALGDSAYLEEAHWYLAKAFLRQKNVAAARAQLTKLVQLRGSRSAEAQRLLTQIEAINKRSD